MNRGSPAKQDEEVHPLDGCCGFNNETAHYVWVGEAKGRYQVDLNGMFHYVGPHNGPFEREEPPPDHTPRCVGVCCAMLILVLVLAYVCRELSHVPIYDCEAGFENWRAGWSQVKQVYCCQFADVACPGDDGHHETTPADIVPRWLSVWLPEVPIGSKFLYAGFVFLVLGCCWGMSSIYICARYCTRRHNRTEEEIIDCLENSREAQGGEREGEIVITMTWDSHDELDMQLELPGDRGIICHRMPEIAGGKKDINRNAIKAQGGRLRWPPVENIYWEPYCPYSSENPPNGEYNLFVRVLRKRDHHKDTSLTVSRTLAGHTKLYHRRIPPGTRELHICDFMYVHPRCLTAKEKDMIAHHKLLNKEPSAGQDKPLILSMVWDTKDVLDLQVMKPNSKMQSSMDGSVDSHPCEPGSSRSCITIPDPVAGGLYEIRVVITDKKDERDVYITVVVNMRTKRKVFHHKIEGEASCFVGTFMYKPPPR